MVTAVREASAGRLWQALGARASTAGTAGLERMLEVEAGSRVAGLDARAFSTSSYPAQLARYGMAAKARTISRLSAERRAATLLAVAMGVLLQADEDLTLRQLWEAIESHTAAFGRNQTGRVS